MDVATIAARLEANGALFATLFDHLPSAQAQWRSAPEQWSLLEVAGHLLDEEREDFRVRLDLTLHAPDVPWPAIDPAGWVTQRHYQQQSLEAVVAAFGAERARSVAWLRSLGEPDLAASREAPWGVMHAGDLLAAWLVHDWLHIRQISRLQVAWLVASVAPYRAEYAGEL